MTLSNIDTGYMIQLYLARGSSEAVAIAMISLQQVWLVTVMTVLRSCCQGDWRYAALQYGLLQTMSASQSTALTIERMQVANRVGSCWGIISSDKPLSQHPQQIFFTTSSYRQTDTHKRTKSPKASCLSRYFSLCVSELSLLFHLLRTKYQTQVSHRLRRRSAVVTPCMY